MSLSLQEKQSLYHTLGQLVRTGIPFPGALEKLFHTTRGDTRRLVASARKSLAEGHTVGEAFARQSALVTPLEIAIIGAVEKSGQLERGLSELAAYFKSLDVARKTVLTRLAYPVFLLHFGVLTLSLPTLFLKSASQYGREVGTTFFFVYGAVAIIALLTPLLLELGAGSVAIDRLLVIMPLTGPIRRAFALSRFCAVYGLQLDAGINVIDALRTAGKASRSGMVKEAANHAAEQVGSGAQVGPCLGASGAFPDELTRSIIVGEETGSLDEELRHLAMGYRETAIARLEIFADWLPKILYVVIVLAIGWKMVETVSTGYVAPLQKLLNE